MESASSKPVTLQIEGMTCSNCATSVEQAIKQKGGKSVNVNFSTGEAQFTVPAGQSLSPIKAQIEKNGYQVHTADRGSSTSSDTSSSLTGIEKKFYFCLIFALPLFLHMFIPWPLLSNPYFQLALSLPVFIVGMRHFGQSAYYSLKSGYPNMDVLITLGAAAAFFYSLTGTVLELGPAYQFYETAAMILTLVLLGNVLEQKSVQRTTQSIQALAQLQPDKAHRITNYSSSDSKQLEHIPIQQIQKDDYLQVNTGDKIPVDGKVIEGEGAVDESMITGESLPVEKEKGAEVVGSTVLQSGNIIMQATAVGEETVLSQIIQLVKNAQSNKPSVQKLADKISAIFVPTVLSVALFTFIISYGWVGLALQQALMNSIAVLVIACPCALGLATPTAVMVGIGKAAQRGILIKKARTLEHLSKLQNIVFDKTGTLTTGDFTLKNIHTLNGASSSTIKSILVGLEQHSSHPIARSIRQSLSDTTPYTFESVEEIKGSGIKGVDSAQNTYTLGSYLTAQHLTDESSHALYLSKNDELIAYIDIEDEIKPEAKATLRWLKEQGYTTYLVSGDHQEKCALVAQELGIDHVYAEQLPDQKLQLIEQLSEEAPTAMVGDGVNDAPALSRATIGISLSNATHVAIESAEVILLQGNLDYLRQAFKVGGYTLRTIRQNLFWAFFYNVLAIPVAAIGLLNPMIAALSMAFSDVVVVGNSLRLRLKRLF